MRDYLIAYLCRAAYVVPARLAIFGGLLALAKRLREREQYHTASGAEGPQEQGENKQC